MDASTSLVMAGGVATGGCSGSSSLKPCRPTGFRMETGRLLGLVIIG